MSTRLADVGKWRSGGTPPKDRDDLWGGGFPWISTRDLKKPELSGSTDTITEDAAKRFSTTVPAGSILIGTRGMALAKRLPVAMVTRAVAFNQDIKAIEPDRWVSSKYLLYALLAFEDPILALTDEAAHGTKRLDTDLLRAFRIPCPGIADQARIADLLDAETTRIDAMMSARERQRVLLIERHRSQVAVAVATAGAQVRLASAVASIEQGSSPQCEDRSAGHGEVGVLKLSAVSARGFSAIENKLLVDGSAANRPAVRDADLLVTRANTPNLVGLAAVARLDPDAPTLLLPDLIYRLTLREGHDPDYVQLALSTPDARSQMTAAARGSSQSMVKLRGDDLRELRVPLPAIGRQRLIAHQALEARVAIDLTLAAIDRQIALLRERRQALITAAVTGRLQVPGTTTTSAAV
ncbi:MAG: restriction endonuclease subunit S [Solirubrobacteraceae bacterium]